MLSTRLRSRLKRTGLDAAVAPSFTANPVLSGTAAVANNLTTTQGTATNASSYSTEWLTNTVNSTAGGTLLPADTNLLSAFLDNSFSGLYVFTKTIAHGAGGLIATAFSNILGPVAAAAGPTAPVLTLTSAVGNTPEWDTLLGSDTYEGYYLHIEASADGVKNGDGTYTTPTRSLDHQITAADIAVQSVATTGNTTSGSASVTSVANTTGVAVGMAVYGSGIPNGTTVSAISGSTVTLSQNATATATGASLTFQTFGTISHAELVADGWNDLTGTWSLHSWVLREDGVKSAISNELTGTVTAAIAAFATAAPDKSNNLTLSNSNRTFVVSTSTGALNPARVEPAPGAGKWHAELHIDSLLSTGTPAGNIGFGVCGEVQDFTTFVSSLPGAGTNQGCTAVFKYNSATVTISRNGGTQNVTLTGSVFPVAGDIIGLEFDDTANTISFYYKPAATGIVQTLATITLTSNIPATWHAFGGGYKVSGTADGATLNTGQTAFAITPNTGYNGW